MERDPAQVRRLVKVVFQTQSLDKALTVAENLRVQGHLHGLSGATLRERKRTGCDRLVLLHQGNIVAQGSLRESSSRIRGDVVVLEAPVRPPLSALRARELGEGVDLVEQQARRRHHGQHRPARRNRQLDGAAGRAHLVLALLFHEPAELLAYALDAVVPRQQGDKSRAAPAKGLIIRQQLPPHEPRKIAQHLVAGFAAEGRVEAR